jgi:hypothetical protein
VRNNKLLEVRGLINAFSTAEYAGILCLIIKFAIMAYYCGIKEVLCQINKKFTGNVSAFSNNPVDKQISTIFILGHKTRIS